MDDKEQWMLDNYETLEKASTLIDRYMKPWMKEQGFSRKGRRYFKIIDDIAYCVGCGIGDLVHTHYYIIPLYIPTDYIYLSYGEEIEHRYRYVLRVLRRTTQERVDAWFNGMKEVLLQEVFPFFEQLSSKEKLLDFIAPRPSDMFSCQGGFRIEKLRVYSYLFLLDRENTAKSFLEFRHDIWKKGFCATPQWRAMMNKELETLSMLMEKSDEEITSYFQTVCEETRSKSFQTKRR